MLHSLCRIDGDVSDANTKVYGNGSAIFKIFSWLYGSRNEQINTANPLHCIAHPGPSPFSFL